MRRFKETPETEQYGETVKEANVVLQAELDKEGRKCLFALHHLVLDAYFKR